MSTWREFWGRVAWPWPNVPLARTSEILKRHLKGEITLHPNALAALADTIGVEAPRWLCTRDPWDRGGVAMCLVHLLEQSTQYPPDPLFPPISVALAVFALTVDDYPGGISKPSSESRATRASGVLRLYDSKQLRLEDYENLLAFGLLGLLKNPGFYSLNSDNITSIASALGSAYRMDKSCTQLPFLPHTFDLEEHLLRTILEYLRPIEKSEQFTIGEEAWSTLLDLLNMQPHIWAHNIQVYDIIAETLERAKTGELQKSCLTAIGSQWAHTPLTYLLETLFDHGTFRTLLKLLKGHDPSVTLMVMHPLWMMVSKTLELSQNEYVPVEHQAFDASSALRSAVEDGLFFSLGQLFRGPLPGIAPHHVDMWLWVLENLSRIFPREIVHSNVLIAMAVFYDSNVVGHAPGLMTVNETCISSADRLRVLHSKCTDIAR